MVVPNALRADHGKVEVNINARDRDVVAVDFFAQTVGIGHRVNGRLQQFIRGGVLRDLGFADGG